MLLEHFIRQAAESLGVKTPGYPKELLDQLSVYHFPGNIRELQGLVFDAVARAKSNMLSQEVFRNVISAGTLQPVSKDVLPDDDSRVARLEDIWGHFPTLLEAETYLIDAAMTAAKGNQGIAASMLGLKRQTLNMRLTKRKDNC